MPVTWMFLPCEPFSFFFFLLSSRAKEAAAEEGMVLAEEAVVGGRESRSVGVCQRCGSP